MPELLRAIAGRLREFVGSRRYEPRRRTSVPVTVTLPGALQAGAPPLEGRTHDLSARGLAVVLPAIRVGGRYLAGANAALHLTLELPAGTVQLRAVAVRYERLEGAEAGYLVGMKIVEIADRDRDLYAEHLRTLKDRG